ncbi:MAG TPA: PEPxxWA-CTERM sorting domain-containing protein [Caulobacteraceae bacterium]
MKSLIKGAALVAAMGVAALASAPSQALANVTWAVHAFFDDKTTLTGTFTVNVYGFLQAANLTTETNGVFNTFTYTMADSYAASDGVDSPSYVDFQPGYQSDLHIVFANPLTIGAPNNPIEVFGTSFECQGSFSCFDQGGGNTRFIAEGFAVAPEPGEWALMLAGFAGVGAALRRRRPALTA